MVQLVLFLAVVTTAMALVPGGAHLLELVNKMRLEKRDYFVVQSIYRGWASVGIVVTAAFAANVWAATLLWERSWAFWLSAAAAVIILATLVLFFGWTQPVNRATGFWSVQPDNWPKLRRRWEYSHAANALMTFAALCCTTAAAVVSIP